MNNKKVFCRDCRFYKEMSIAGMKLKEWCTQIVKMTNDYYAPRVKYTRIPKITNVTNDCPHYIRRWWKFWIKP